MRNESNDNVMTLGYHKATVSCKHDPEDLSSLKHTDNLPGGRKQQAGCHIALWASHEQTQRGTCEDVSPPQNPKADQSFYRQCFDQCRSRKTQPSSPQHDTSKNLSEHLQHVPYLLAFALLP